MKKKLLAGLASILMMFVVAATAHAALIDFIALGIIYDDDLDISWLGDGNYAKTSGYDDDGLMSWSQALAWADQLEYGGYNDWRLATIDELSHLYYAEGVNFNNPAPFTNLPLISWSGTEFVDINFPDYAWFFHFHRGNELVDSMDVNFSALAVRPGSPVPIPIPGAVWLLGSGLAGIFTVQRRRERNRS